MGGALLKAWAANTDHEFTVADPAKPELPEGVTQVGSVEELGEQMFDYLIVALKPQLIDDVLPAYLARLSPSGVISSIAAGYSAEKLAAHAPGRSVIRIMPNLPAMIGKGVSGLYAHGQVPVTASSCIEEGRDMFSKCCAPMSKRQKSWVSAKKTPKAWFSEPLAGHWNWLGNQTCRLRHCARM